MGKIKSGLDYKGDPCEFYMDSDLVRNAEPVKEVVRTKDFDFVSLVCGIPGAGKSNFAINLAKYFDEDFNIDKIAFTAEDFIEITNKVPKHSAVVLDESFASLNSKVGQSSDFQKLINHLQLIRQKNLFIILNLPNFFDLHKNMSLYRSSWLFLVYSETFGKRGTFQCFDRNAKRILYVKGSKYMDYQATRYNFHGRFTKQKAIDDVEYERRKKKHLESQGKMDLLKSSKPTQQRNVLLHYLKKDMKIGVDKLMSLTTLSRRAVYMAIETHADLLEEQKK